MSFDQILGLVVIFGVIIALVVGLLNIFFNKNL